MVEHLTGRRNGCVDVISKRQWWMLSPIQLSPPPPPLHHHRLHSDSLTHPFSITYFFFVQWSLGDIKLKCITPLPCDNCSVLKSVCITNVRHYFALNLYARGSDWIIKKRSHIMIFFLYSCHHSLTHSNYSLPHSHTVLFFWTGAIYISNQY